MLYESAMRVTILASGSALRVWQRRRRQPCSQKEWIMQAIQRRLEAHAPRASKRISRQPRSPEMQHLLAAPQGKQEQTNRFPGLAKGTTSISEFFSPEHIWRIMAAANGGAAHTKSVNEMIGAHNVRNEQQTIENKDGPMERSCIDLGKHNGLRTNVELFLTVMRPRESGEEHGPCQGAQEPLRPVHLRNQGAVPVLVARRPVAWSMPPTTVSVCANCERKECS
jgi:hypothetical protein